MGLPSYILPIMGKVVLDPITIAWLAQLTTSFGTNPSSTFITAINTMIAGMRTDGNLLLLDRLFIYAQEVQDYARVSIVNPSSTQLVEVNTPTWTANYGYQGGGIVYLNSKFTPSVDGVNFTLNSASMGCYVPGGGGAENTVLMGAIDIGSTRASFIYPRYTGDLLYGGINKDVGIFSASNTSGTGLISFTRTASNLNTAYRNGVSLGTSATVSTAITNEELYILGLNNNGLFEQGCSYPVAITFMGGGGINMATFYSRIQTFATTIGFNV